MSIRIKVIDHRATDFQPEGPIINVFSVSQWDKPGPEYADFCALYEVWQSPNPPPDIIGFFGYRKYLLVPEPLGITIEPAHAPQWYACSLADFDKYRDFLSAYDGAEIKRLLAQYDILQAAPFPVTETNGKSMMRDFQDSRSTNDAWVLDCAVRPRWKKYDSVRIYPYLFITRWSVFDRMMREIEPVRQEVHGRCRGEDSVNHDYKKRPMAYVMERVYSLWLENSGLSIKEMPLLHCWEKH